MSDVTPIQTVPDQTIRDRVNEALGSVWTASESPAKHVYGQGPFQFTGEDSDIPSSISSLIESCTERLLISTSSFSNSSVILAIENALQRGVCVYMFIDSEGFDSMLQDSSCNALHGNVLLRERSGRGLDAILVDWHLASREGYLLATPLDGTLTAAVGGWVMQLSKSQVDEFSQHLQHEFWSLTEGREVLAPAEIKNPPSIAEAPFRLRSIQNQDHILRAVLAREGDDSKAESALRKQKKWSAQIRRSSGESAILLRGEAIEVGTGAREVLFSSPEDASPQTGLYAHKGLPLSSAIGDEVYLGGWDRSATGEWHSLLRLNAEQAKAAKALFESHIKAPEWVGHTDIKLGDAGNRIIREGQEMTIANEQSVDLGVVHLDDMPDSSDALESHEPTMQAPADDLARQCTFEWITAPPVVPASAKEDALHEEWMSARKDMAHRLNALNEVNQPSKFPGFIRKQGELKKLIDSALEQTGSVADPKGLSDLVSSIEALTEAVGGNIDGIKAAENESLRSTLEKEQREAHKNAVQEAKNTVKSLTPKIKKEDKQLSSLEAAAKKAEDVEKKRIESDIAQLRPKIGEMKSQLTQAKETSGSKFEFKPPADISPSKKGDKKAHKFLGDTRAVTLDVTVPKEALPEGGTLFRDGDDRYLAISHWEEVPQGRKDAERLKASLCAVREVIE